MSDFHLAVVILVGPGEVEEQRLGRLLGSLFFHAATVREIVLVDDAPDVRPLAKACPAPAGVKVTVLRHECAGRERAAGSSIQGAVCVGLLQALQHFAEHSRADAVVKIDTDALVIGPFADRLGALLRHEPELGTAGVVEWNCDGSPREWEPFRNIMRHLAKPFILKHPLLSRRIALWGSWGRIRRLLRRARRHGYPWGEHAQGGCYLISRRLIQRMHEREDLAQRAMWLKVAMAEDPMMGLYSRAHGLKNVHFARPGEVFGVAHQGLPLTPEDLVSGGYALVHSLKNDPRASEEELYQFFQTHSLAGSLAVSL